MTTLFGCLQQALDYNNSFSPNTAVYSNQLKDWSSQWSSHQNTVRKTPTYLTSWSCMKNDCQKTLKATLQVKANHNNWLHNITGYISGQWLIQFCTVLQSFWSKFNKLKFISVNHWVRNIYRALVHKYKKKVLEWNSFLFTCNK